MNKQAAGLIFGGQFVMANTQTAGTTDLTVKLAVPFATSQSQSEAVLGVAGADANVVATQTGAANAYGEPAIDLSVLLDYIPVYYGGWDIWVWYSAAAFEGQLLVINTTFGTVGPYTSQGAAYAQASGDFAAVVARCTHPGGVAAGQLTQSIGGGAGGGGTSVYFLGRARLLI
jgi:hypothetical protein